MKKSDKFNLASQAVIRDNTLTAYERVEILKLLFSEESLCLLLESKEKGPVPAGTDTEPKNKK